MRSVRQSELRQRIRSYRQCDLLTEFARLACLVQPDGLPVQASPQWWTYAPPWAIAALARDAILFGNDFRDKQLTPEGLVQIFNAWAGLYEDTDDHDTDPLTIISRHAFEQFPYQESTFEELSRTQALLIDGARQVDCAVITEQSLEQMLGAPAGQVVGATLFLHVAAFKNSGWFRPAFLEIPDLDPIFRLWPRSTIEQRLSDLTMTVPEFRADFQAVDRLPLSHQRWAYNPLTAHPFVERDAGLRVAPQPFLILRTITPAGLYYPGVKRFGNSFAEDLGRLTEHYVGRQLACMSESQTYPEVKYGRSEKKSIDWFWVFDDLVVLVEVKSMRATVAQRAFDTTAVNGIIERLDYALKQLGDTNKELDGLNPSFAHIPHDRPRVGVIVTAEPFYNTNSVFMREKLQSIEIPTLIASLREIEHLVTMPPTQLQERLLAVATDQDLSTWTLSSSIPPQPGETHNPILDAAFKQYPFPAAGEHEIGQVKHAGDRQEP
jgi:hypothetical protein